MFQENTGGGGLFHKGFRKICLVNINRISNYPVGTRYCGGIGFLLDFHRDAGRLRFETEVTSLCDIFFQHHNDAVAITQCNLNLHVMVIPIFNIVLISDKDENAILFHLSKYSDKLCGNIVCKMQIPMSNLCFTCICRNLLIYFSLFTFELHTA